MGFFGSLSVGATGLVAQSNKFGIISDNIANVNTTGYKESVAGFSYMLLDSNVATYSAQGVKPQTISRISKPGLLQQTNSTTDLAISGNGFFIVNNDDNPAQMLYTRAGSFTTDRNGDFKNAAGLYLQGWPLDASGTPTTALQRVNIQQISGAIISTTELRVGINLNAEQTIYQGAGATAELDPLDVLNANNTAEDIIVPNGVNQIQRGDQFIISTGGGLSYNYTYGGFTIGRNVADSSPAGNGDNGVGVLTSPVSLVNPFQTAGSGSGDVIITMPSTAGLSNGDVITLNGSTALGGISAAQMTGSFVITVLSATQIQITTTGSDPAVGGTAGGGAAVSMGVRPYVGGIFDATNANTAFFSATGTAGIRPEALSFTISVPSIGTKTFFYTAGSPNAQLGQFNSLSNLANAIDETSGLTARVVNGRLYVGAEDGNESVTFANTQPNGTSTPTTLAGVDWIGELGLSNVGTGTNRFSTLNSLTNNVNVSTGLKAVITNPLGQPSVNITVNDPLDTITFSDRPTPPATALAANAYTTTLGSNVVSIAATVAGLQVGDIITLSGLAGPAVYNGIPDTALNGSFVVQSIGAGTIDIAVPVAPGTVTAGTFGLGGETLTALSNNGSVLGQLGITPSLNGGGFPNPAPTTGAIGPAYDPNDTTKNMAGGTIAAQFARSLTIYDADGEAHDVFVGFIKTGVNEWAVEVYARPASDVASPNGDGLLASGSLTFNGDGSLASISPSLSGSVSANWTSGASNNFTIDWGTAGAPFGPGNTTNFGTTEVMSQLGGGYTTKILDQNGATIGDLTEVTIDKGDVVASYSNGDSQRLYRIPLAMFRAVENMEAISENVYLPTASSGDLVITAAGTNGAGDIFSARLESSNTDLATQLTDMIIAQRSYQFSSRLISVSEELLQDLTQMGAR